MQALLGNFWSWFGQCYRAYQLRHAQSYLLVRQKVVAFFFFFFCCNFLKKREGLRKQRNLVLSVLLHFPAVGREVVSYEQN